MNFWTSPTFSILKCEMVLKEDMDKKIRNKKICQFEANPDILPFLRMSFFNFFLNHMVQKYQNEISPIFYYGISRKTYEKDLKIPTLQLPDWKSPYWMTLYVFTPAYILKYCRGVLNFRLKYLSLSEKCFDKIWLMFKIMKFKRIPPIQRIFMNILKCPLHNLVR